MHPILSIHGEEIRDSRGRATLSVSVEVQNGSGNFEVPSGASVGSMEAVELRDADGSMQAALRNIREKIAPALIGMDVANQSALDAKLLELDGTPQKSNLGGNTTIGVSIAAARAAAVAKNQEVWEHLRSLAVIPASRTVPYLYLNYINGGKHATSPFSFQEHIIVPEVETVAESLAVAAQFEHALTQVIRREYGEVVSRSMGDEGGFVLPRGTYDTPFELSMQAIDTAGLRGKIRFALDAAASSFFADGEYTVDGKKSTTQLADMYAYLCERYSFVSIEDPFEEHDLAATAALQTRLSGVRIVGDDLTVTSAARIREAARTNAISAVIIKPNQVGTLSETLTAMRTAREQDVDCIISHRSGETMDHFIADLAFAFGAFGIKAGSLRKEERMVKYSRLRALEELSP